jgi:hypothetical protein
VKTYGEVFGIRIASRVEVRADASGEPADKQTIGLLQRRHVSVGQIMYIGRESNQLEEVDAGTVHDAAGVYTEYVDPRREIWFRAANALSLNE